MGQCKDGLEIHRWIKPLWYRASCSLSQTQSFPGPLRQFDFVYSLYLHICCIIIIRMLFACMQIYMIIGVWLMTDNICRLLVLLISWSWSWKKEWQFNVSMPLKFRSIQNIANYIKQSANNMIGLWSHAGGDGPVGTTAFNKFHPSRLLRQSTEHWLLA